MVARRSATIETGRALPVSRAQIQPKLRVGAIDDPMEREADAMAQRVISMPAPEAVAAEAMPNGGGGGGGGDAGGTGGGDAAQSSRNSTAAAVGPQGGAAPSDVAAHVDRPGAGRPLSAALRAFVEPRFGADFANVRVHDGAADRAAASRIGARAFTLRHHIWLGPGESAEDGRLMAHELTHVTQQTRTERPAAAAPAGRSAAGAFGKVRAHTDAPAGHAAGDAGARSSAPARMAQHNCACGAPAPSTDECTECKARREEPRVRTKGFTINEPGDAYEQDADRMAEQVMRTSEPAPAEIARGSALQRSAADPAEPEPVPPIVHDVLRSPGQRPDPTTRAFFERRFGRDFSGVRIHTDARAADSARAINAQAYTAGQDVVFAAGQYAPGTTPGKKLLAHELAHTLQQGTELIRRQPVIKAGNGTTDELKKELKRLEIELSGFSEKCVGVHGNAYCPPEVEQYSKLITKLKSRIAERGDSKLPVCDLKLSFNGSVLQFKGKKYNGDFPAVSGKPVDGKFDYSKERQKVESAGPIPEGEYWINPDELKSLWYYPSQWVPGGVFSNDWGTHRITIHPYDATQTFGRGGFFIHGGGTPGSAGCIDLTNKIQNLAAILEQFVGCKILLSVSYPQAVKLPVSGGTITSPFGARTDPFTGKMKGHKGIDIAVKVGTPVSAIGAGKIIKAGWENDKDHQKGYGQRIVIDLGNGRTMIVGHLSKIDVQAGDSVTDGQQIGKSGNTGHSTGPHVHYEVRQNGQPVDPLGIDAGVVTQGGSTGASKDKPTENKKLPSGKQQLQQDILDRLVRLGDAAKLEAGEGQAFKAALDGFKTALEARIQSVNVGEPLPADVDAVIKALALWSTDPGNKWGEGWWDSDDLVMSAPEYATVPASQYKCNAYVAEVVYQSTGQVFKVHEQTDQPGKYFPFKAKEWGYSEVAIDHYDVVGKPQLGDVWSNGKHTGIYLGSYSGKKLYISARDVFSSEGLYGQFAHGIQIKVLPDGGLFRRYTASSAHKPQKVKMTNAVTTASLYTLRKEPSRSADSLAELPGDTIPVTVNDKATVAGELWYQVTLRQAIGDLKPGTKCWIIGVGNKGEAGVIATIAWSSFIKQLRKFESDYSQLTLDARITKLRQWSHDGNLPFDSIIGTEAGSEYLDTRSFIKDEWQLLKDSQIVRMPDGKRVDVYHLMVGLDVLPRKVEDQSYLLMPIGPNYSAALFAGDIGAAVADAYLGKDQEWEKKSLIPPPGDAGRAEKFDKIVDRYYETRAPESDLLADIDAWGLDEVRAETEPDSIEKILKVYYAGTSTVETASGGVVTLTTRRKSGIESFFRAYGLNTEKPLATQARSVLAMALQIRQFAEIWFARAKSWKLLVRPPGSSVQSLLGMAKYLPPMTQRFVNWLEKLAKVNRATVKISDPSKKPKSTKK